MVKLTFQIEPPSGDNLIINRIRVQQKMMFLGQDRQVLTIDNHSVNSFKEL